MDFPLIKLNNKAPQIVFLTFHYISNKKTPEQMIFRSFNYLYKNCLSIVQSFHKINDIIYFFVCKL